jgi:hypothetical protein
VFSRKSVPIHRSLISISHPRSSFKGRRRTLSQDERASEVGERKWTPECPEVGLPGSRRAGGVRPIVDTPRCLRSAYKRSFSRFQVSVGSVPAERSKGSSVSAKPENEEMEFVPAWAVAKILTLAVFIIATLEWWAERSPRMLAIDLLLVGLWLAIRRLKPADYDPAWPRKLKNDL